MTYKMRSMKSCLNRGIEHLPTMTMVTQVLVDQNDPGFKNPTKPIGHFMTQRRS